MEHLPPRRSLLLRHPLPDGSTLYFGCNDGNVYAVHAANGTKVWTITTNAEYWIWSSPILSAVARVRLSLEDNNGRPYAAHGQDVALVRCAVIDSKGHVVPGASNHVTFTVSGSAEVYGVGNGDPANLTPDKIGKKDLPYGGVWIIPTFMGLVRAIVEMQAGVPGGGVVVHATSPGLQARAVSFTTV